jgi:hypothetical protein
MWADTRVVHVACMRWMRVRWDGSSMGGDLWVRCGFGSNVGRRRVGVGVGVGRFCGYRELL